MKDKMPDNFINMCCILFSALALLDWKRQAFVRELPDPQEVIAEWQWGTLISWKTYPFLIKACWLITQRKANGDHTTAWWQRVNFDLPFLSLRRFSFKPKSAGTAWENGLLPTFIATQLTGQLSLMEFRWMLRWSEMSSAALLSSSWPQKNKTKTKQRKKEKQPEKMRFLSAA